MTMIEALALTIVLLTGLYFIFLGTVSLLAPVRAKNFLLAFASSARAHYAELCVRILIGAAFVLHAPRILFPDVFSLFGWVLLVTSACLLLIPWQWHQRFAQLSVPPAIRYIALIGMASLAIGGLILVVVILGKGH